MGAGKIQKTTHSSWMGEDYVQNKRTLSIGAGSIPIILDIFTQGEQLGMPRGHCSCKVYKISVILDVAQQWKSFCMFALHSRAMGRFFGSNVTRAAGHSYGQSKNICCPPLKTYGSFSLMMLISK